MPLFRDGPALRMLFSNAVARGQESHSSAETMITDAKSGLWQITSDKLLEIGQMDPERFHEIQSHIRELADVYRLKTSMSHLSLSFFIVLTDHSSTKCSLRISNKHSSSSSARYPEDYFR
jgi:hypothetical protein